MLLLKKLCRFNSSSSNSPAAPAAQSPSQPGYADADLNESGNAAALLCNDWPTGAYRIEHTPGVQQRRTPPPLYHSLSLPATPPPSYTEPSHRRLTPPPLSDCHDPEVPQVVVVGLVASQSGFGSGQPAGQRQASHQYHHEEQTQHLPQPQPQQQQEQLAARRRQRLHSLQRRQPRLHLLHRRTQATSEDSDSTSSASENEAARQQRLRQPSKQLRQRYRGLRDVYCPDILNACSLILHQQQWRPGPEDSSDSSVRNFTDSPPPPPVEHSSDDYAETAKLPGHHERPRSGEAREGDLDVRGTHENPAAATRYQRLGDEQPGQMGQNLSLRRPRISLTWVLREQQQQQQEQRADQGGKNDPADSGREKGEAKEVTNNNNGVPKGYGAKEEPEAGASGNGPAMTLLNGVSTTTAAGANTTKKRYRLKQVPGCNGDPLNGYATTPTAYTGTGPPAGSGLPEQKFFSNQNLLDYRAEGRDLKLRPATKELFFVCTPQRLPSSLVPGSLKNASYETSDTLALAKKRNEIRKRLAVLQSSQHHQHLAQQKRPGDGAEMPPPEKSTVASSVVGCKDDYKSLKGTYSEPSLIAASEGVHHRRHRHRKRRERQRQTPKFGYEIANVEEFLAKCSLASPANIPVVLAAATTLYQTKPGGYQAEVPLPLGMVVNAVFKNQNWLYVQTPHAEEGYVGYKFCLPLGILPTAAGAKPQPCWESNGDVFPRPCGNMTDSEKEIHLRGGTRSDGARTPRGAGPATMGGPTKTVSHNPLTGAPAAAAEPALDEVNGNGGVLLYGEHQVDKLYLRAASQAKIVEKTAAYAQLRSTQSAAAVNAAGNEEYREKQQQQQQRLQSQRPAKQSQAGLKQPKQPFATNGQNGQHLHPHPQGPLSVRAHPIVLAAPLAKGLTASRHKHELRQTLVAINVDYRSDGISLQKGEIVTLCECRVSKDNQQWFYVRTRDGREGFIPAEVAGHGYL